MNKIKIYGNEFDILSLDEIDDYKNPKASIHITNGDWDWYVIAGEVDEQNDDIYCFGLVNGFVKELGFFYLREIFSIGGELVMDFIPIGVYDIYPDFDLR